ncbi:MAG: winged helix-turn-helix domain-containing protein [archaeon]|nr:winged helix-turn-helix domain-containing protein [archaeon]
MTEKSQKKSKKRTDWHEEIIKYIKKNPSGLTITDIALGIGTSRVTVTKYVNQLLEQEKIFVKQIGWYKLYFSVERQFVPLRPFIAFYKNLLLSVKEHYSTKEDFKELGKNIGVGVKKMINTAIPDDLIPLNGKSYGNFLKYFGQIFPYFDFLMDPNMDIKYEIDETKNKGNYIFSNIALIKYSEEFESHFYLLSGIMESAFSGILEKDVFINVDQVDIPNNFVKMTIEIK